MKLIKGVLACLTVTVILVLIVLCILGDTNPDVMYSRPKHDPTKPSVYTDELGNKIKVITVDGGQIEYRAKSE